MRVHTVPNKWSFYSKEFKLIAGGNQHIDKEHEKTSSKLPLSDIWTEGYAHSVMVPMTEKKNSYPGTENSCLGLCHIPHGPLVPSVDISFWGNPHLKTKSIVLDLFY